MCLCYSMNPQKCQILNDFVPLLSSFPASTLSISASVEHYRNTSTSPDLHAEWTRAFARRL